MFFCPITTSDQRVLNILNMNICFNICFCLEYQETEQPKYMAQQLGTFEVHKSDDPGHGNILRQMVLEQPVYWNAADQLKRTMNAVGNYAW